MLNASFIPGSAGRILNTCFTPADGQPTTWLLFCPPWAEEMNKSRRMMARLGHALAGQGVGLCLPDLYGTGDSAGEFGEARWALWREDLQLTSRWLRRQGCQRLLLGGLRAGCLLAAEMHHTLALPVDELLFWQPLGKGEQQLIQFLRLRMAAGMSSGSGETVKGLRAQLAAGESLEIAGYELAPALAEALEQTTLGAADHLTDKTVHWFEIGSGDQAELSPAARPLMAAWQAAGARVQARRLAGDPFWTTQELVDVPALIDASVMALTVGTASG